MDFNTSLVNKLRERAERHRDLTERLNDPAVASDPKQFPEILRERGSLERSARMYARYTGLVGDEEEALAMLAEGSEGEERAYLEECLAAVGEQAQQLEEEIKEALISQPEDERDRVIVEIRAGTGGDEAALFAGDLFRMYTRYIEPKRWKLEVFDARASEVGGFKEITFAVKGAGSWRALRFESGGHRVQRVPATEAQGRIHTSAATVAVLPEPEEAEIEIRESDLKIDTFRSSGPGGQSVNKTSSAVRVTHLPTDTVVSCQDEKSQHKNKAKALRILRSRLLQAEQDRMHAERAATRKSLVGTGDRSQRVRTYNFPQNRVTDHRLGQNFSLEQIVDGRLDALIEALQTAEREARLADL
ncbi:MAG: peptide chain release factor 1 [Planctomycetota bacterium]|nr:MAG: peptide chain release factor 1 [Planctomycetota bacterium]